MLASPARDPPEQEQRMASSFHPEQQMAAALRRKTPVPAAPAGGAGRVAPDRAAAAAAVAAIQRQKAAQRARETDAFYAKVASARSLADQNFARRGTAAAAARPPYLPPSRFSSQFRRARAGIPSLLAPVLCVVSAEQLKGLKDELRGLQSQLREAVTRTFLHY